MISDKLRAELLDHARELAASAPPFSDAQREDLRALLNPAPVVINIPAPATRPVAARRKKAA